MTIIEDSITETNIVVGCRFTRNVRRVAEACRGAGYTVVTIVGGMKLRDKEEALRTMVQQENVVLVCNMQAVHAGINELVCANVCIVYSADLELDVWTQFHGRLDRPGQTRQPFFFHLVCTDTVEERFFKALTSGVDVVQNARNLQYALELLG
jgi:SNF2 family DNA or RNA helicase